MSTDSPVLATDARRTETEQLHATALAASLTVKDLQKSMAWYRDVAGFTVDEKFEREGTLRAVALRAGNVRIVIGQDDGAKGWDRVKGQGLSLQLTTDQNIDAIANRIKERGGTLELEPTDTPWGARLFRLRDPDGYNLAISSPRPA
jgi:uncharacterized glyoxalase superfamily protein PhnB